MRARGALVAVGLVAAALAARVPRLPAQASAVGSRHLAVDHWAYEYIRRLRVRGYLPNLNPLVQPYRRLEVAQGLAGLDPAALSPSVAEWVRLLRDEFAPEIERLERPRDAAVGVEFTVGGRASTGQRLDPLRPLGDADAWPRYAAAGWFETGPLAAESRLAGDGFLTYDPDGLDPGQRRGGRVDNGYLSVMSRMGGVELGRIKRNWSALGSHGLMISDRATSYPQLAFEVHAGRLSLRSFTGELDTLLGAKRYVAAHRIDYAAGALALSVGEALLYAGPQAGYQLRYLNPVEFFFFDAENPPHDRTLNVLLEAEVWYRRAPWRVHLEVVLDDMDVVPLQGVDPAPPRYGIAVGVGLSPTAARYEVLVEYQQVSSYAYRTTRGVDHYSFLGRGLGENFADHDRLTIALDAAPAVRGLLLRPQLQLQRQGEGDFRIAFPADSVFRASPWLLLGVVETTYRLGLAGRYQPNRRVWIGWDLGQNFIRNAGHSTGVNRSKFSAVGELGVTIELPLRQRD